MNCGQLSKEEMRRWIRNRFYYQKNIPVKDALVLSSLPSIEARRAWITRIISHDGTKPNDGAIEAWLQLGKAAGIDRAAMLNDDDVLPGVRFAVDSYVNYCRLEPWHKAVASSLTELFAPAAMAERIHALEDHYQWIDSAGLGYFRARIKQAPRDVDYALTLIVTNCTNLDLQKEAVSALSFKCDVLWSMLDAIETRNNA